MKSSIDRHVLGYMIVLLFLKPSETLSQGTNATCLVGFEWVRTGDIVRI